MEACCAPSGRPTQTVDGVCDVDMTGDVINASAALQCGGGVHGGVPQQGGGGVLGGVPQPVAAAAGHAVTWQPGVVAQPGAAAAGHAVSLQHDVISAGEVINANDVTGAASSVPVTTSRFLPPAEYAAAFQTKVASLVRSQVMMATAATQAAASSVVTMAQPTLAGKLVGTFAPSGAGAGAWPGSTGVRGASSGAGAGSTAPHTNKTTWKSLQASAGNFRRASLVGFPDSQGR